MKIKSSKKIITLTVVFGMISTIMSGCTESIGTTSEISNETTFNVSYTSNSKTTENSLKENSKDSINLHPGLIQKSTQVDFSYFDDAVFIGDSVSLKLKNYITQKHSSNPDFMGKSQFLVAGSLGTGNALWKLSDKSVHPVFNGEKMLLEDGIKICDAKKVYIMLGLNDMVPYGIDKAVENMSTLIQRIKTSSPNAIIILQSATPIAKGGEGVKLTNKALVEYNQKLLLLCEKESYFFIDIASEMKDENGYLKSNYASDSYVHFTDTACDVWINYLRTHTIY